MFNQRVMTLRSMNRKQWWLSLVVLTLLLPAARAQKVLQMEKVNSPKTEKMYIGDEFTYQLKNDDYWYHSAIKDLLVDEKIIVLHDRFIHMDSIAAFRWERTRINALGRQFFWFGLGWSGFALVGTLTDGNPDSNYRWSDAGVTALSGLLGLIVPKVFRYKTRKFGKRRRLRMLDLTITSEEEETSP